MRGQLTTVNEILAFMLAGNATLTLQSRSGKHYTYEVKRAKNRKDGPANAPLRWFVSLLSGPDNTADYTYIGLLEQLQERNKVLSFRLTSKSRLGQDTAPVAGFSWFVRQLVAEDREKLKEQIAVFHEGRCGKCGRMLTDPVSIQLGIGPICRAR